jgi:acyl-CoA synthetase (NDP forming)
MTAASRSAIARLLRPRSIAIVGASADPFAVGARVLVNLEQMGFTGDIHLVTRRAQTIGRHTCVPTIEDLPEGVDAAVLVVPEAAVADSVASCIKRGVGGGVVFAAGFAEVGEEGKAKQERITAIARAAGFALNGPNCMGFSNFVDKVSFSFGAVETDVIAAGEGGAAVIAQSGAMMGNIASALGAKGVPINYTISTGNEAVTGAEDFLGELIEDPKTKIFVLFLEQIRHPTRFLELIARARALGKPIVLMHPGSTERARQSAQSHTGAMAGDYAVMQTVLRHHGVVQVDTMDELIDTAMLLARWPKGARGGAAICSNSGAVRGISLDFCATVGLDVPRLTDETVAALRPIVPAFVPADNPLDLATAGMGQADIYGKTGGIMLDDPNVGCAILAMVPGTPQLQMAKGSSIVPLMQTSDKPIAFVLMGDEVPLTPEFNKLIRDNRMPFFRSPDRAMRAMAHVAAYGEMLAATPGADATPRPMTLPGTGTIAEYQAKAFLASAGIPMPQGGLAKGAIEAQGLAAKIGYPLVMKVQAAAITHKSDVGGVALNICDSARVQAEWEQLRANAAAARPDVTLDGILIEKMSPAGTEMIVGARRDPDWGPVLLVGLGGIWAEAFQDFRLIPADAGTAKIAAEIAQLKGAKLLGGLRGSPPLDMAAIVEVVGILGRVMRDHPAITEVEINPLLVRPAGQGVVALDALMVVRDAI